jgi:hypothetical protein
VFDVWISTLGGVEVGEDMQSRDRPKPHHIFPRFFLLSSLTPLTIQDLYLLLQALSQTGGEMGPSMSYYFPFCILNTRSPRRVKLRA